MTISTYRRSSSDTATVRVAWTERRDGDFHPGRVAPETLRTRQRAIADLPWTTLRQVHGNKIVRVTAPGDGTGVEADGAITDRAGTVLSAWVGDCAPVVMIGVSTEIAVVHGGWRGLANGVVDNAIAAFDEPIEAAILGPVIGPCCYEFDAVDAERFALGIGVGPESITSPVCGSKVRLDIPAAIAAVMTRHEIGLEMVGGCTGCCDQWFSHRVRNDPERHAMAVWQGEA